MNIGPGPSLFSLLALVLLAGNGYRTPAQARQEALAYVGEQYVSIGIGDSTLSFPVKIAKDKTGKLKISATF